MDSRLKVLKNALEPVLTPKEIVIDSIEYVKEGTYFFLRIVLDKINGIDLDTIVEATNLLFI